MRKWLLTVAAVMPFALVAQSAGQASRPQPQKPVQPPPKFQADWWVIPKTFKGDDIVALMKSLNIKKDEFESTTVFNRKIANIAAKNEQYAFFPDIALNRHPFYDGNIEIKYNADKESFDITIQLDQEYNTSFLLSKKSIVKNPYAAQNAYGTKAQVHDVITDYYYLRINEKSGTFNSSRPPLLSYSLEMKPTEAKKNKNKIKVAFIVQSFPYQTDYGYPRGLESQGSSNLFYEMLNDTDSATVSDPYKRISNCHYLNVRLLEIWFYHETTGEIYEKFTFDEYSSINF